MISLKSFTFLQNNWLLVSITIRTVNEIELNRQA